MKYNPIMEIFMKEYAYHELGSEGRPNMGYAIIGNTVFRVERGQIDDSWELSDTVNERNVNQIIKEAREVAEMPGGTRVYVDLEGEFSPELSEECGRLLTPTEYYHEECSEEEREDMDSYAEFCLGHF